MRPDDIKIALGRMRCLHAMGEWSVYILYIYMYICIICICNTNICNICTCNTLAKALCNAKFFWTKIPILVFISKISIILHDVQ